MLALKNKNRTVANRRVLWWQRGICPPFRQGRADDVRDPRVY